MAQSTQPKVSLIIKGGDMERAVKLAALHGVAVEEAKVVTGFSSQDVVVVGYVREPFCDGESVGRNHYSIPLNKWMLEDGTQAPFPEGALLLWSKM